MKKGKATKRRKVVPKPQTKKYLDRDFPYVDNFYGRKAVCKRCHVTMFDAESMSSYGEFYHPSLNKEGKPHSCKNSGLMFKTYDLEIEPWLRKSRRRYLKRMGYRP